MSCGRALLCIIFPPLAVLDRGCGTILIVGMLTLIGWLPGVLAALILNMKMDGGQTQKRKRKRKKKRRDDDFDWD